MDVVSHNLSDHLFDLILGIVFDYAASTSRANVVRAFGSLISSLTKANPKKVIAKLLPRCAEQIRIELEHGASSIRTTSAGLAIPSDTSLHWRTSRDYFSFRCNVYTQVTPDADMAILRAIVSSDGFEVCLLLTVLIHVLMCLYSWSHTKLLYSTSLSCSRPEQRTNVVSAALVA
jgi:hypothetical protein